MQANRTSRIVGLWFMLLGMAGCAAWVNGARSTPEPSQTMLSLIEEASRRPEYLADCRALFGRGSARQAEVAGLKPGVDTQANVLVQLGAPAETRGAEGAEWYYSGLLLNFRGDTLDSVFADGDRFLERTLKQTLMEYGCPDLILGIDQAEEPNRSYSAAHFVFSSIGASFLFRELPVPMDARPLVAEYFLPGSVHAAAVHLGYQYYTREAGAPLEWVDAVAD